MKNRFINEGQQRVSLFFIRVIRGLMFCNGIELSLQNYLKESELISFRTPLPEEGDRRTVAKLGGNGITPLSEARR
jgi:hypothetical protein